MKGLTSEQAIPLIKNITSQVVDPAERDKIYTQILGEVESFEARVRRICARLDGKKKYQIKKQ